MPVLPVMSRLCPSQIFRLRSLIRGLSEEGAVTETRSSRKAVSDGSAIGHPGALGQQREVGRRGHVSSARNALGPEVYHLCPGGLQTQDTDVSFPTPQDDVKACGDEAASWTPGIGHTERPRDNKHLSNPP